MDITMRKLMGGAIAALVLTGPVVAQEPCPEPPSAPYVLTGTQWWMNTAIGVDANGCTIWQTSSGGDPDAPRITPPGLSPAELGHEPGLPDTAMER